MKQETKDKISLATKGKPRKFSIPCIPTICDCKGRNGCSSIVYNRGRKYKLGHHVNINNPIKNPEIAKKSVLGRKDKVVSQSTKDKISKNHRDMKGSKNHMYGKVSYGFK